MCSIILFNVYFIVYLLKIILRLVLSVQCHIIIFKTALNIYNWLNFPVYISSLEQEFVWVNFLKYKNEYLYNDGTL